MIQAFAPASPPRRSASVTRSGEKANSPTVPLSVIHQVAIDVQRLRNVRRARTILRHRGPHALSRAAKALQSLPRAPINASTMAALRALHPQAVSPMGPLPAHHAAQLISVEKVLDRCLVTSTRAPTSFAGK